LVLGGAAIAQGECRKCVAEKLEGASAKAAAGAALGAVGGAAGSLPGSVCGAIIGAVAAGLDMLIDVSQCDRICRTEASRRKDPEAAKCEQLMNRVKGRY
jgi:hypothetical protein